MTDSLRIQIARRIHSQSAYITGYDRLDDYTREKFLRESDHILSLVKAKLREWGMSPQEMEDVLDD